MKPSKAWQLSLDFIRDVSNKIYFIELNNNSEIIMTPKESFEDADARGIGNTKYATKNYVKYLAKYLKSIHVNNVSLRFLGTSFNRVENAKKELAKYNITLSNSGFPIWSEPDRFSNQHNDWFGNDKRVLNKNIKEFIKDGITPIGKIGKYNKNSVFPNFVVKPPDGKQGREIVFYKQPNIIEKKNYITQEFIVGELVDSSLNYLNGKLVRTNHSPRLCDYRSKIIIDNLGNIGYVGTHRRTSSLNIPKKLEDGKIDKNHLNYHTYICNISQNARRSLLTTKEEIFWEELCNKVGKTIYRLFLK